jgi:hypothetical protein
MIAVKSAIISMPRNTRDVARLLPGNVRNI